MEKQRIDLQKLPFFKEGNTFTGSSTKDPQQGLLLRYLVYPDKKEQRLLAYSWTQDLCFEKAEDRKEAQFSLTEEGLSQVREWLTAQYEAL